LVLALIRAFLLEWLVELIKLPFKGMKRGKTPVDHDDKIIILKGVFKHKADLNPCPLCDGETAANYANNEARVYCLSSDCGIELLDKKASSVEAIIYRWNSLVYIKNHTDFYEIIQERNGIFVIKKRRD